MALDVAGRTGSDVRPQPGAACGSTRLGLTGALVRYVPVMIEADDVPDPTALYRLRDGAYAVDLLIAAVTELDLFSWLAAHDPVQVVDRTAAPALSSGRALSSTRLAGHC